MIILIFQNFAFLWLYVHFFLDDISRYKKCYLPNALRPRSVSYLDLYCDDDTLWRYSTMTFWQTCPSTFPMNITHKSDFCLDESNSCVHSMLSFFVFFIFSRSKPMFTLITRDFSSFVKISCCNSFLIALPSKVTILSLWQYVRKYCSQLSHFGEKVIFVSTSISVKEKIPVEKILNLREGEKERKTWFHILRRRITLGHCDFNHSSLTKT